MKDALTICRKTLVEQLSRTELQHGIAKKFKPFIMLTAILVGVACVRERGFK